MRFHIYRTSSEHIHDENYKFKPCSMAYDGGARRYWGSRKEDRFIWRIDLDSLEALAKLQDEVKYELILDFYNYPEDCDGAIEIYDYPRE